MVYGGLQSAAGAPSGLRPRSLPAAGGGALAAGGGALAVVVGGGGAGAADAGGATAGFSVALGGALALATGAETGVVPARASQKASPPPMASAATAAMIQ